MNLWQLLFFRSANTRQKSTQKNCDEYANDKLLFDSFIGLSRSTAKTTHSVIIWMAKNENVYPFFFCSVTSAFLMSHLDRIQMDAMRNKIFKMKNEERMSVRENHCCHLNVIVCFDVFIWNFKPGESVENEKFI